MVRVFIGEKEVKKEDLGNYEIKSDKVKQILASRICVKEERKVEKCSRAI